jgi:MoxR-like ATPase
MKSKMKETRIEIPTQTINFEQYDPRNLVNWGEYIEVGDEMKLLEMNIKEASIPYIIEGDKGTGKTLMVHTICRKNGYALLEYSCSNGTNKGDLIGRVQINENGSFFELGILPLAYEIANHFGFCVLYLDELNATEHEVMKLMNRPTDKRRSVFANGKLYKLNEGCKLAIVGTMNPLTYAGVNSLTEDLRSRFIGDIITYPTSKQLQTIISWEGIPEESVKNPLLQLAQETNALRVKGDIDYVLSPRDIDQFCEHYRILSKSKKFEEPQVLKYALKQVVLVKYAELEERELVKSRIVDIFGVEI